MGSAPVHYGHLMEEIMSFLCLMEPTVLCALGIFLWEEIL